MSKPIENCPVEEKPMRDRAWTAEQEAARQYTAEELESHCGKLWDSQWTNVVNHDNCYAGWDKADAINHAVKLTEQYIRKNFDAYAATLRQQAQWGDGEVSSEVVSKAWDVYLSCAEVGDQGMRAAIEAVAPLLRAPAERGGRVDEVENSADLLQRLGDDAAMWASEFRATAVQLGYSDMDEGWLISWFANAIEHSGAVRRWRKQAAIAQNAQAATAEPPKYSYSADGKSVLADMTGDPGYWTAQNAQGEAVGWISDNDLQKMHACDDEARNVRVSHVRTHLRVHPIFLQSIHAERARVPAEAEKLIKLIKQIKAFSGVHLRAGTEATDGLFRLAVEHGANETSAAVLAHDANGELNELQSCVFNIARVGLLAAAPSQPEDASHD